MTKLRSSQKSKIRIKRTRPEVTTLPPTYRLNDLILSVFASIWGSVLFLPGYGFDQFLRLSWAFLGVSDWIVGIALILGSAPILIPGPLRLRRWGHGTLFLTWSFISYVPLTVDTRSSSTYLLISPIFVIALIHAVRWWYLGKEIELIR